MPERDLSGKICIVTGAGSGVGRGIAQAVAAEGARVAATDLDQSAAADTAETIAAAGGEAEGWSLDVTDDAAVSRAVVLVPGGLEISAPGFTPGDDRTLEGQQHRTLERTGLAPGSRTQLALRLPATLSDPDAVALIKNGDQMLHEGYISLQAESHPVEFRNIELRVLEQR